MGDIIDFRSKKISESDLNNLLKQAIEIGKESLGKFEEEIFKPEVDLKTFFASMINGVLLKERCIDTELFLCSLYVSEMLERIANKVPNSYFVIDYYVNGWEKGDPSWYRQGGDLCCMTCVLFEGFANRRNMRSRDYTRMGMYLYYLYYLNTNKDIGWCMSNNFRGIVEATKRGIESL